MTFILAVSGKKQSGKSTLVDFLLEYFESQDKDVRCYSFADDLKEFLVNAMGLKPQQVYGTDKQKNSLTTYKWENLPLRVRWDNSGKPGKPFFEGFRGMYALLQEGAEEKAWAAFSKSHWNLINKDLKKGYMTARELMQVFGTDLMRQMFDDKIWVNATFRRINNQKPDIALIPDLRFPSEIEGLQEHGGFVVRLTRDVSNGDLHSSEVALDDFDWDNYEGVRVVPEDATIEGVRAIALNYIMFLGYTEA